MTDIVQADIFFFVSTIAVVAVAIAIIVAIYYVVSAIQEVRRVIHIVEREVHNVIAKRRAVEVHALTFQKVLKALMDGELFHNRSGLSAREDEDGSVRY